MTNKLSFAEAQKEAKSSKNNSDLLNLAHALENIRLRRQELAQLQDEIENMATQIEGGRLVTVEELKDLYKRTQGKPL